MMAHTILFLCFSAPALKSCTTATLSYTSIVTPGRPSLSDAIQRNELVSSGLNKRLRSASAVSNLRRKKPLSILSSFLNVHMRTRIFECGEYAPRPSQSPSESNTSTVSPTRARPLSSATALSNIQGCLRRSDLSLDGCKITCADMKVLVMNWLVCNKGRNYTENYAHLNLNICYYSTYLRYIK